MFSSILLNLTASLLSTPLLEPFSNLIINPSIEAAADVVLVLSNKEIIKEELEFIWFLRPGINGVSFEVLLRITFPFAAPEAAIKKD
jgi:hypothetical protein